MAAAWRGVGVRTRGESWRGQYFENKGGSKRRESEREREREREHAGGEIVVGVGFLHHQHDQPDDQSGFGRVKY